MLGSSTKVVFVNEGPTLACMTTVLHETMATKMVLAMSRGESVLVAVAVLALR